MQTLYRFKYMVMKKCEYFGMFDNLTVWGITIKALACLLMEV